MSRWFARMVRTGEVGGARPAGVAAPLAGARGSLLVTRTEEGLRVFTGSSDAGFGGLVAAGLGVRAEAVGGWPSLDCGEVFRLRMVRGFNQDSGGRVDGGVVSEMVSALLPVGGWLGVGVRRLEPRERRWLGLWRAWNMRHLGFTVAPVGGGVEVGMSMVAGGPSGMSGVVEQAGSVLGLPVPARGQRVLSRWWWVAWLGAVAVAAGVAGGPLWGHVAALFPHASAGALSGLRMGLWGLLGLFGAGCLLVVLNVWKVGLEYVMDGLRVGKVRVRQARARSGKRKAEWLGGAGDSDGLPESDVGTKTRWVFPLPGTVLPVEPGRLLGLFAPPEGVEATRQVEVPAPLVARCGPLLGDVDGVGVHVEQQGRFEGFGVFGKPGKGKSVTLRNLLAFDLLDRATPQGLPGCVGGRGALVIVDAKGGTDWGRTCDLLSKAGVPAVLCELGDPSTPAVDMFPAGETVAERAAKFVGLMQSAMKPGAIEYASSKTLQETVAAGLVCTPGLLGEAGLGPDLGVLDAAGVLLGLGGDGVARRLAGVLASHRGDSADMGLAVDGLVSLFGMENPDRSAAQTVRRQLSAAPQSKVTDLLTIPGWWSPGRPRFSWEQALREGWVVVLGVGPSSNGVLVNESTAKTVTAMLFSMLCQASKTVCDGWQAQGRSLGLFCDEVGMLVAGGDGADLAWARNKGREFGWWLSLATQQAQELPRLALDAMLSFGSLLWLQLSDEVGLRVSVADLNAGGGDWSSGDVANLPDGHGILRTHAQGRRLPPVPLRVLFRPDAAGLLDAQRG